ncbi:hypothetical protein [uncultured Brevibacillus sp.]|uniref:hypothetical protein n=1 Tax=uncultured Brevibacillus sp. TaxID=169970 RepID=UPI00259843D5|nr:hypothetical protein [uncultured Brevibacillus sp.]
MLHKQILLLLAILLLTGCNEKSSNGITSETINQAFDSSQLPLIKSENADYFILSGKSPEKYSVNGNLLYMYVFASEEDAKEGLKDFFIQAEKMNIVVPQIFEAKNVLLFYLTPGTRTDPYFDRDKTILSIVNSITKQ